MVSSLLSFRLVAYRLLSRLHITTIRLGEKTDTSTISGHYGVRGETVQSTLFHHVHWIMFVSATVCLPASHSSLHHTRARANHIPAAGRCHPRTQDRALDLERIKLTS